MWSEAREAVCQGLPVSGRAGGPGPSPLAAVLGHLRYPHRLSRVPTSLCSHSRLVSKRSHKWQLWVRWWLRDVWFSCPVGATQTGKFVPAKPGAGLGLGREEGSPRGDVCIQAPPRAFPFPEFWHVQLSFRINLRTSIKKACWGSDEDHMSLWVSSKRLNRIRPEQKPRICLCSGPPWTRVGGIWSWPCSLITAHTAP